VQGQRQPDLLEQTVDQIVRRISVFRMFLARMDVYDVSPSLQDGEIATGCEQRARSKSQDVLSTWTLRERLVEMLKRQSPEPAQNSSIQLTRLTLTK